VGRFEIFWGFSNSFSKKRRLLFKKCEGFVKIKKRSKEIFREKEAFF
jgi:hypothetical protein